MTDRCFRVLKRCPEPRARVVCFPHAGGAASFFRDWGDLFPHDVEVLAVRYPGREDRLNEPLPLSMTRLTGELARACARLADRPLVLFGHSMGGSVAHEVAVRLETGNGPGLALLCVSARQAPGHQRPQRDLAEATDEELMEYVRALGGTEAQAFEVPELRELVLPAIRADFRLLAGYEASNAVLDCPVIAYRGTSDVHLEDRAVRAWASVTTADCVVRAFQGGHFYLADRPRDVVADLVGRLPKPAPLA